MRSECWATEEEIEEGLSPNGSGPPLYNKNGVWYTFDREGHLLILGVSGAGKSRRCTIPMTMSFIENGESAIIVDPKGEIYTATKNRIPEEYELHVIDFRNLYDENAEGWNPLSAPYKLWCDGKPKNRHRAEQMIEDLAYALYPDGQNKDPFWESATCLPMVKSWHTGRKNYDGELAA